MTQAQPGPVVHDTDLLRARIETLLHDKTVVSGRGRRLRFSGEGGGRGAVLGAIRETERPRRLVFKNERAEVLAFDVVSGRILRLSSLSTDGLRADPADEDAANHKADPATLGCCIHSFCHLAQEITVEALPLEDKASAVERGIDVGTIPFEGEMPAQSVSQSALVGFLQGCEGFSASALLLKGSDVVHRFGAQSDQDALAKIARSEREGASAPERAEGKIGYVLYTGHPTKGPALMCQACGDYLSLLCFNCRDLPEVLAQWQVSFGSQVGR